MKFVKLWFYACIFCIKFIINVPSQIINSRIRSQSPTFYTKKGNIFIDEEKDIFLSFLSFSLYIYLFIIQLFII